jgi:hypothetical protein
MKETAVSSLNGQIVPLLLGVLVVGIVVATVSGKSLPLLNSPKAAMIAVLVIGLAMCAPGIGAVAASGQWLSPLAIIGYLLGAAILGIGIASIAGWKLPFIAGESQALIAVAGLMAVKFVIGTAGMLLRWL